MFDTFKKIILSIVLVFVFTPNVAALAASCNPVAEDVAKKNCEGKKTEQACNFEEFCTVTKDAAGGFASCTFETDNKTKLTSECSSSNKAEGFCKSVGGAEDWCVFDKSVPSEGAPTGPTEVSGSNGITATYLKDKYENSAALNGYNGPIPKCAFSGTCRSTNDLLLLLINIGKYLFSIIGTVALAAFIYGGFTMIFSFGNSEKVKAGRDAMVAAVVGLIIAFSAYLIINFVLDALQVDQAFRGLLK